MNDKNKLKYIQVLQGNQLVLSLEVTGDSLDELQSDCLDVSKIKQELTFLSKSLMNCKEWSMNTEFAGFPKVCFEIYVEFLDESDLTFPMQVINTTGLPIINFEIPEQKEFIGEIDSETSDHYPDGNRIEDLKQFLKHEIIHRLKQGISLIEDIL